jgi:hypothetical protein
MIDQQDNGTETVSRFQEREPVIGRRWGGEDLVSGYFVQSWGTDGEAVLVETLDGERIALVGDTVETVEAVMPANPMDTAGRHRQIEADDEPTAVLPKDLLPLPGDDEPREPVEWPTVAELESLEVIDVDHDYRPRRNWLVLAWFSVVVFFGAVVDELAVRFENAGQDVIDHARVIAKVFFATLSALIVVGAGTLWWLS